MESDNPYLKKFIEQSMNVHNHKYDYGFVVYKNNKTKVKIICPNHGVYYQTPYRHLHSYGCILCANNHRAVNKTMGEIEFINFSQKIHHNKYTYENVTYINSSTKISIHCPIHGEFFQTPKAHLKGQGCKQCGNIKKSEKAKMGIDLFIDKSNKLHLSKYDYSGIKDFTTLNNKYKIICPIHGEFYQTGKNHIKGCGCSKCNTSKGEQLIDECLKEWKIKYEKQAKFNDCVGLKNMLPFDFYLPEFRILIEYDGEQHFRAVWGEKSFLKIKRNDEKKNTFADDYGYKLIRLSYLDSDIKTILKNKLTIYLKEV